MSRAVWKFPFREARIEQIAPTPIGSTPRFFAFQGQTPTVWVEVEQSAEEFEAWTFVIVGTGDPLPAGAWQYVGSDVVAGGAFVFHAYARLEQGVGARGQDPRMTQEQEAQDAFDRAEAEDEAEQIQRGGNR